MAHGVELVKMSQCKVACLFDSDFTSTANVQWSRTVSVCKRLVYISSCFMYLSLVSVMELPLWWLQRLSWQQWWGRLHQSVGCFILNLR